MEEKKKLDDISKDVKQIIERLNESKMEKIKNEDEKPKKSKKIPENFDWTILDKFIFEIFENLEDESGIRRDELFENFIKSGKNKELKLNKYMFESRCNKLLFRDVVYFNLK